MKKLLFTIAGLLSFALGLLGIVLPLLPTTPLLLLALYCFAKGSSKMCAWLKSTPLYRKYLSEYERRKALTLKQKLIIQICSGLMIMTSFFLMKSIIFRVFLVMAFIVHNYVFIFRIKTYSPERKERWSAINSSSIKTAMQEEVDL